jgi:hypothetical protein
VELAAPTTALVIGFPLVMMLVMLLMNTVEQWLTSPRPAPLRLVAGGGELDAAEDALAGVAGFAQQAPETDPAPAAAIAGGLPGDIGHPGFIERPTLALVRSTLQAAGASAFDVG